MSLSKDGSTVRRGTFGHSVLASTPYRQHAVGAVANALILTLYMCGSPAAVYYRYWPICYSTEII
jgi:hypothetical protein